jgi:hypothetical protein
MSLVPTRRAQLAAAVALLGLAPAAARGACNVNVGDRDGNGTTDLRLIGAGGRQTGLVEIRQDGYLASVDCNGDGDFADAGDVTKSGPDTIESYYLELGGGDVTTLKLTEALTGAMKNVVAVLPSASNKLTLLSQGFALQGGTSLMIDIVGGGGAENVTLDFTGSTIDASWVTVRGDLYAGNDTFKWVGAAQTLDSTVDVDAFAGPGRNVFHYSDGAGQASGSDIAFYGEGSDVMTDVDAFNMALAGSLDNGARFELNANLLSGSDRFNGSVNLASFAVDPFGPAGSEAYVRALGNRGLDILTLSDGGSIGPATINGLLSVELDGGNQPDTLNFYMRGITGSGTLRYRGDAGIARDNLDAKVSADASSTNILDVALQGGPENDLGSPPGDNLKLVFNDDGATTAPFGAGALLDGGLDGQDRCDFAGTGTRRSLGCELGTR